MFRLLNEMLERRLQVYTGRVGANTLLYYGAKTTQTISVELTFSTAEAQLVNGYRALWEPSDRDTLIFADESVAFHDRKKHSQPDGRHLGAGHQETRLFTESGSSERMLVVDHVIGALRSWKIYLFHDTSPNAGIKKTGDLHDNERLRPDASNLAAYLYRLEQTEPACYARIVKTIRLVAPFFGDFVLRPSPLNPDTIRLEWRDVGSDAYFDAATLSDGTLRFMCLATLLLQPDLPSVILIDEPELGLHPYAIVLLASLLERATQQTQILISTQSVPLINQFLPEDVIVVDREDKQSTFKRLEHTQLEGWLEDYGLGELWEKNIIGGKPQQAERSL